MDNKLLGSLEELINSKIEDLSIPHIKGKSIRIKSLIVRHSKKAGWLIYDTKSNTQVAKMFCKTSAIALAKIIADKQTQRKTEVLDLDKIIQKHYNDCVFYKHTMNVSKDSTRYENACNRYDISIDIARKAQKDLEQIILS
jgi:hypothetical protein